MVKKSKKEPEPSNDKDKNKPQRGLAIGENFGWTGKLPVTLLNEHCQKQKWGKCQYDMTKKQNGFIGIVTLNWENPKTKEIISLKYYPNYEPKSTTNEARHMVATFVLHRINYIKNMKMLLPIIFRDYWNELEENRVKLNKENKQLHDKLFNVNPFQVYLQEQEENEKREKQRLIKKQNEVKVKKPTISLGSKTLNKPVKQVVNKFPRKVWEKAPFLDIPSDLRSSVEEEIKHHITWVKTSDSDSLERLVSLGFRETHVKESFEYTSNFTESLEWLLFHIPEDDLPQLFMKSEKDSKVSLKISQNLQFEYALKRMKESGFDTDIIISTYNRLDNDEFKTCIELTKELLKSLPEIIPEEDSQDLWNQEIEGLQMMDIKIKQENNVITIPLNPKGIDKEVIGVKVFKSENYPNEIPGIQIIVLNNDYQLANYVKLSIIRNLVENLHIGECMIYAIIEWLEEHLLEIINNPGSLLLPSEKKVNTPIVQQEKQKKIKQKVINTEQIETSYKKRLPMIEKTIETRSKLSAWSKKDQLVNIINSNKVTLITGETGSGKSTQVVQFILDYLNSQNDFKTTILCTQPRRISTIGLAERISEERSDKIGNETGYIIRGENRTTNVTRISFVTTGVLLRMIQSFISNGDNQLFENLGYIFIDEVHERSIDCDFLLIILKMIMKKFPVKIVLMSATIDDKKFKDFFNTPLQRLHIEGRTFPIKDYYLDAILKELDYSFETNDGIVKPQADSHFFQNGNLNYDLIAQLTAHIDKKLTNESNLGSILIFLPGIMEINQAIKAVRKQVPNSVTLPLHSALSSAEQKKVFKSFNGRKIVVSTNVAETSITIPDCVTVIDSGRSKTMFFDTNLNTTKLIENWCSKAEIGQRRGRSGRVTNGNCYHLYTKETVEKMLPQPIPEIKRTKLENLYLVVKSMGISKVEQFLSSGLDAPDQTSLASAKKFLQDIGALENDKLSNLGKYISYLPTDPSSGKLLILGCIFGCLDFCLTLAAISSTGSPFLINFEERDKVKHVQRKFANGYGDFIGFANAYNEYVKNGTRKFLNDNYLSYTTINDIKSTKAQYLSLLQDLGFVDNNSNINNKNYSLIRAIISGSFYPQIARVQLPNPKFFKSAQGSIEIDPEAKSIKYWIRNEKEEELPTRVFIHPSSVMFDNDNNTLDESFSSKVSNEDGSIDYENRKLMDLTPQLQISQQLIKDSFIAFRSSHHTTKLYVRDITPVNTISVLLFVGDISYDLSMDKDQTSPGIILDNWLPIRTWCKNGVLIKKLKQLLDDFIDEKLSNPTKQVDENIISIIEKVINI
ncbi:unnamed protein product [Candida verbasci]|uniref:RNA helicase n=1 Tax=Candida verbasci TaxID=1227364 RepID=A0A9W4XGS0_9ASCO|nr:unnamed protein product [Candida verbasci]